VSGGGASAAQQAAGVLQYAMSHDLNTYRERGGSVVVSQRLSAAAASVQVGLDWREIAGEDAQQTYRTPTAALPAVLRIARTNDGGGRQRFAGVFSQFRWQPVAPLDLTLALREDRFDSRRGHASQTNYGNTAMPAPAATTGGAVPDSGKSAFDPSLSAKWTLTGGWDLRGSVYKAFRAPGLNNLYRSFGGNAITIANPLLGPETLVGRELGLDWRGQHLGFSATAFDAQVQHVVATYAITSKTPVPAAVTAICGSDYNGTPNAACPGSVSFYTNGQDQHARGLELDATWRPDARWRWNGYATLTRTHYTNTSTGDPTGQQLPLVPKGITGASVSWRATERWTANAQLRYSSSMLLSALTASAPLRQGGYTVTDLGLGYQATPELKLSASLVNAFDTRYTDTSASNPQSLSLALPRSLTVGAHAWF
jgi:outer membrane receptor protein involved in Fe transport